MDTKESNRLEDHRVVSHDEWISVRTELLAKEKELTRLRDAVTRLRQELPWEAVTKEYVFDGPAGRRSLPDLFEGKSQLIVYHFMFHPDDSVGCPHCSLRADGFDGIDVHLAQRDAAFVVVSRAPLEKLAAYRERMGWRFKWVSSGESAFNYDYGVSFSPEEMAKREAFFNYKMQFPGRSEREGHSVFYKSAAGAVFHTYSCYDRGNEMLANHYHYLDLLPKGRDEGGRGPFWVRRRDEYGLAR
jgi:predicted dithiol-disulfide oxidoreductase (DUF899 family)